MLPTALSFLITSLSGWGGGGCTGGEGGMHVHPVHPPWVRPCQPVQAIFLRSFYGARHLQDFVNSTSKFNSIVVKTLKSVLCFSHDGGHLKFKKKTCRHYSLTVQIFSAWFQPLLNLARLTYLDTWMMIPRIPVGTWRGCTRDSSSGRILM